MTEKKTTWARVQMLLIASVFFGPLAVATWMYYSGALQPEGRTNHGALLEPIVSVRVELPDSEIGELGDGVWLLIYSNDGECTETLRAMLSILFANREKCLARKWSRS